mmetsp:Transcript_33059/g.51367  ORF Transcript_33059/g.51367 Transcript_33059/m.51367 type:complete len:98 (-) Transcript_33059:21-314(-)
MSEVVEHVQPRRRIVQHASRCEASDSADISSRNRCDFSIFILRTIGLDLHALTQNLGEFAHLCVSVDERVFGLSAPHSHVSGSLQSHRSQVFRILSS